MDFIFSDAFFYILLAVQVLAGLVYDFLTR